MTEYDNTNRGAVWGNTEKREGKQDADFRGSLDVEGVEYWVNAWKRKPGGNPKSPALSFSISKKDENKAPRPKTLATPGPDEDGFDDDIPF